MSQTFVCRSLMPKYYINYYCIATTNIYHGEQKHLSFINTHWIKWYC